MTDTARAQQQHHSAAARDSSAMAAASDSARSIGFAGQRVLIVIVNYRTPRLVVDCLRSLEPEVAACRGPVRVVVVDNASGDASVETIRAAIDERGWGSWASTMPLEANRGFAAGNNAAIRAALASPEPPDLVYLLNPDTVVREGGVAALVSFMSEHDRAGVVGSGLEDEHGVAQCSAHRMLSPLSELDAGARLGVLSRVLRRHVASPPMRPEAYECNWVSGAALMVRREVLEEVGLLDEGYFLYFDEVDFCFRVRRAGWQVWVEPRSRVVHIEGAATEIRSAKKRRGRYWYESRRRFFVRAYGVLGLVAADLLWAMGRLTLVLRRALRLGGDTSGDPSWFAWDLLVGDLRAVVTGNLPRRLGRSGGSD